MVDVSSARHFASPLGYPYILLDVGCRGCEEDVHSAGIIEKLSLSGHRWPLYRKYPRRKE